MHERLYETSLTICLIWIEKLIDSIILNENEAFTGIRKAVFIKRSSGTRMFGKVHDAFF